MLHKPSPRDQVGLGQAGGMVANSVPQVKGAERPLLLEAQPVRCKVSRWRMAGGTFQALCSCHPDLSISGNAVVLVSPFLAAAGVRKRGVHSLIPASLALGWQMAPEL